MAPKLSIEDAAQIAERAFLPLECVAEVQDYRYRLGFRIYDPENQPLLTAEDLVAPQVTDLRRLESILFQTRERVQENGYKLAHWLFPRRGSNV